MVRRTLTGSLPSQMKSLITLSRFFVPDLARFSCVSSTCRKLALSSLNVRIISYDLRSDIDECESRLTVMNSIDRFLLSRGVSKMHQFFLNWHTHEELDRDEGPCFCVNESFRVITWILNALRCDVEMLHTDMAFYEPDDEHVAFPLSVFKCASLRSLWVEMMNGVLKTPSFSFSSNLEDLQLNDITADDGLFKWVSCSCKLLKKMSLCRIRGINIITIESLSLEDFFFMNDDMSETYCLNISGESIETIHIDFCYAYTITVLNIIAPKVKRLTLIGELKINRNLGYLDCLEEAAIAVEPIEDEFDKVSEVLYSLSNAEVLILNEDFIKAACREEHMHAQLDICRLRINIGSFTDDLVPSILSLLTRTPLLSVLCISYDSYEPTSLDPQCNTSGFNKKYWKKQDLYFISEVKEVYIEFSGGSNEIEFAKYVLEHGASLQKMVIRYLAPDSSVEKKFKKSCMMTKAAVSFEKSEALIDPLRHN